MLSTTDEGSGPATGSGLHGLFPTILPRISSAGIPYGHKDRSWLPGRGGGPWWRWRPA